jgi:hypothetical protein
MAVVTLREGDETAEYFSARLCFQGEDHSSKMAKLKQEVKGETPYQSLYRLSKNRLTLFRRSETVTQPGDESRSFACDISPEQPGIKSNR